MTEATEGRAVEEPAPAKINLYLHVVGRRADGYHLLDSLVVFPALGDTITAVPAADLSLTLQGPFAGAVSPGGDNLVLRAARALADATGREPRAGLRLTKRLPPASGIGGGSADAAATLRALLRLWRLDPADLDLPALAVRLGADVPMCLAGRPAFIGGIGEALTPAPTLPSFALVLVNPGIEVPTPRVFARRQGEFSSAGRFAEQPADTAALARLLTLRRNDLTGPAVEICPAVGEVLAALAAEPEARLVRMSGSGATCFALFDDVPAATAAAQRLGARYAGWWVAATRVAATAASD